MLVLMLSVIVLLALGGCACVFWTARGDAPRWARAVSKATLLGGEVARAANRGPRTQQDGQSNMDG
ncbi:hypothetical protein [Streptomyces adelaidensis]|uniref:hypothetical protein n=1 Tax=Streptomyces adelaidensis TaxID=2796465 RepID=UPI001902CBF2|nr:hypothetical protein [Streptomyces adelaidensis]